MAVDDVIAAVAPVSRQARRYAADRDALVIEGHDIITAVVSYEPTRRHLEDAGLVVTLRTPASGDVKSIAGTSSVLRQLIVRRSSPSTWAPITDDCLLELGSLPKVTPVLASLLLAQCVHQRSPEGLDDHLTRHGIALSGRPLPEALREAIRAAS